VSKGKDSRYLWGHSREWVNTTSSDQVILMPPPASFAGWGHNGRLQIADRRHFAGDRVVLADHIGNFHRHGGVALFLLNPP
jgi:hypothetical protein